MEELAIHKFLNKKNIKFEKKEFDSKAEKGASNVAKALGLTETQTVKTLIFEDKKSGEHVLIMVGGNQNAISGHLKKVIGSRDVGMATPEKVKEITGYAVGSIPPVGWQPKGFRSFIEVSLLNENFLGVGTGTWGQEVIISPSELLKAFDHIKIVNLIDKEAPIYPEEPKGDDLPIDDIYKERKVDLPHPNDISTIENLGQNIGGKVKLAGWIYNKRSSGSVIFLQFRDGTGFIQAVAEKEALDDSSWKDSEEVTMESSCIVEGEVLKEDRAPDGYEIKVDKFRILKLSPEYPIGKKDHGSDFLFKNRDLYMRSKTPWAVLRIRDEVFYSLMTFLREEGFTRTDSPIFQPTSCEDTTELFEVDYFGRPMYLTQSGQLYSEATEHAFGKVYDFGPVFRAEKSKTRKHLTEFWMMDWEAPFYDQESIEDFTEKMLKTVVKSVLTNCEKELKYLERDTSMLEKVVNEPFVRLKLSEANKILNKKFNLGLKPEDDLNSEAEEKLGEIYGLPVFVKDYPYEIKAFYMKKYTDEEGTERAYCADLIAPEGGGEIGTCAVRNNDYNELLDQLKKRGYPLEDYQWYLNARKYGGVPHAGGGIGPERWVRWISGVHHIRETIPFPRTIVLDRP